MLFLCRKCREETTCPGAMADMGTATESGDKLGATGCAVGMFGAAAPCAELQLTDAETPVSETGNSVDSVGIGDAATAKGVSGSSVDRFFGL